MSLVFDIGDILRLRKKHPCGSYEWEVVRLGVDIGLVCQGCERRILLPRSTVNKRLKSVVKSSQESSVVAGIALFGVLGLVTLWFYWIHRNDHFPTPAVSNEDLPPVTVQLPIYNERLVVSRLIESAINLDYPRHLLQIQVLDDSTDETTSLAKELVDRFRTLGNDIVLIHRDDRSGFKAGALEAGLVQSTGEFVVVFDADFVPLP